MPNDEYMVALNKGMMELESRLLKRDILNAEITGLKETVRVLSSRVQLKPDQEKQVAQLLAMADYATPNLKDSIRALLARNAGKDLTAVEIRDALEGSGFNFDDFSNPLSACHATLKRMDADDEVATNKSRDGKTSYRIKLKIGLPSPPTFWGGGPLNDILKQPALDAYKKLEEANKKK
jgi:hypothetical protein